MKEKKMGHKFIITFFAITDIPLLPTKTPSSHHESCPMPCTWSAWKNFLFFTEIIAPLFLLLCHFEEDDEACLEDSRYRVPLHHGSINQKPENPLNNHQLALAAKMSMSVVVWWIS